MGAARRLFSPELTPVVYIQGRSHRRIPLRAAGPTLDGGGQHHEMAILDRRVLHVFFILWPPLRRLAVNALSAKPRVMRGSGPSRTALSELETFRLAEQSGFETLVRESQT